MAKNLKAGVVSRPATEVGRRLLSWGFFAETWSELKKVTWPSREEAIRLTTIVIAVSLFAGLVLGIADYIFSILVELFV